MGGNSTKIRGLNKFVEWKEEHNLFEIDFSGPRFTWSNGRKGNDRILERLDKAYANSCWQNIFPQAYLIHGAIAISNHAPIILMTEPQKKKVKRNYKVEAWSLEYKQCEILAKEKWSKRVNGSPMYQCARKIQYCREGLKKWSLDKRKEWQGKWDIFEKDLIEAQLIMEDTGNDEKFEQIKARMEEYSGERPVWKPSINNQIRKEDMVRSLINEDTNEWDNLKLEQNFSTNTITKILSIEIMERGSQDDLVWKKEKMGYYTVRSGYSMQLDAQKAQMNGCIQRNWSHLWKANMNNKWKVFLWKLLNNSLPVGKEFIKRKIVVDSMCRFCETNVESLEHLFRDCNMSKHIWAAGRLGLRTYLQSNVPLGDWVWNWFKMLRERKEEDSHRFNYFTATLWAIWCARNEITFNKGSCSAKGILDRVENTFSIEMQGRTRNKENETRKRNDDPEEPPGFERKKKLEEPPVNTSASVISANVNSIPLLNGTNFKDWKENISIVLGCMDLDLALRTDKPAALTAESTADQERDFERWDRSNRMCVMIMKRGIPESFRGSVSDEVTAKEFLEQIEKRFVKNDKAEISTTLLNLISIKYKGQENIREYIMEMSHLASKLKALKLELSDDLLVHLILISLPAQFS
ncbi:hypothetical protein SOVF_187600 [Spinacia oleracea]|nr:hypothetical protein SOVF_187600 [Spinacia oleracea]